MTRLSVRAFANNKDLDIAAGVRTLMQTAGGSTLRSWLDTDQAAAEIFWLGHGMTTLMSNGGLGAKLTIVVLGDGFAAEDQDAYNRAVDDLLLDPVSGLFAQDFFSRHEKAFNVLRVNLVSVDSGVSTRTYDANGTVTAQATLDTALDHIYSGSHPHCWLEGGPATEDRVKQALSVWAPEHRLVLVILNEPGFGGCGGGGRGTITLGADWGTVAHELGHALGDLADEYCGTAAFSGDEPGQVNITTNSDRTTLKWASHVLESTPIPTGTNPTAGGCADYTADTKPDDWDDNTDVGLFEGATHNRVGYGTGIYRPVVSCRMRDNQPPYCPVCRRAMDSIVAPYLDDAARSRPRNETENVADDRYVRMVVRFDRGQLRIIEARQLNGPLVVPHVIASGLAHEVRLGDRRIAVGSMPDANIRRSMSTPAIGPHNTYEVDTFDFEVRIAASELRGRDLTELAIDLVQVHESRYEPISSSALRDDPSIRATPIASLRPTALADLPEPLRRASDGGAR